MDIMSLLAVFIVLMFVICGGLIFILRQALFASTDSAVLRLNEEIAKANAKQAELTNQLRESQDELARKRAEAKALTDKMRSDAQQESKSEREKIIHMARQEGEEIITKAHNSLEKIKSEVEKEADMRLVTYSVQILNDILSDKAKKALDKVLINEFVEKLKEVDMNRISREVNSAELITMTPIDEGVKSEVTQIIRSKLNRDIRIEPKVDEKIVGGAIIKFGSMALDGSVRSLIKERGSKLAEQIEIKSF